MYQTDIDVANLNLARRSIPSEPSAARVEAQFETSHADLSPNEIIRRPCKLSLSIRTAGTRRMLINRSKPVIPFWDADAQGLPHGLPQLSLYDTSAGRRGRGGVLAFSLPLDLFYARDLDTRLKQGDGISADDFVFLDSERCYSFTYDMSEPSDHLSVHAVMAMGLAVAADDRRSEPEPERRFEVRVGPPHRPDNISKWYPMRVHSLETVTLELERSPQASILLKL